MIPVILKKKIGLRVENGHPWIFGNEIAETDEAVKPGDIVTVFNGDKKFIGKGFFNPAITDCHPFTNPEGKRND